MSRIERVTETQVDMRLARDGGPAARTRPEPPMFPGGLVSTPDGRRWQVPDA